MAMLRQKERAIERISKNLDTVRREIGELRMQVEKLLAKEKKNHGSGQTG